MTVQTQQTLSRSDMMALARLGALQRLQDIERECNSIFTVFPDLKPPSKSRKPTVEQKASASVEHVPATKTDDKKTTPPSRRRRRRKMTPAQRRAVSLRMKRYWAEHRKA